MNNWKFARRGEIDVRWHAFAWCQNVLLASCSEPSYTVFLVDFVLCQSVFVQVLMGVGRGNSPSSSSENSELGSLAFVIRLSGQNWSYLSIYNNFIVINGTASFWSAWGLSVSIIQSLASKQLYRLSLKVSGWRYESVSQHERSQKNYPISRFLEPSPSAAAPKQKSWIQV